MNSKSIVALISLALLITSCAGNGDKMNDDTITKNAVEAATSNNNDEGKTGTFTFNGRTVSGTVETQYFGSDKVNSNFSVLCQYDEKDPKDLLNPEFALLQITFLNEKDATSNANFKLIPGSKLSTTGAESGSVIVSLSGSRYTFHDKNYAGNSKSTGTIKVEGRQIIITNMKLYPLADGGNDAITVDAKIPF